jgi:hypothetical protein
MQIHKQNSLQRGVPVPTVDQVVIYEQRDEKEITYAELEAPTRTNINFELD